MNKVQKLFGEFKMSWGFVIAMSLITAIYTALINQVPFLSDTSFADIAISFECWILFAIFIIVNCEKWWEAVLKCFVFFLISQPLIYLIEVPFYSRGWEIFMYYPYWGFFTLLTIPGSFIAFWIKKNNILSAIILSVATCMLVSLGICYLNEALYNFPHHILSSLFCFAQAIFLILVILKNKRERVIVFAITTIALISSIYFVFMTNNYLSGYNGLLDSTHSWSCIVEDESIAKVNILNNTDIEIKPCRGGKTSVTFINEIGNKIVYDIEIAPKGSVSSFVERSE